MTEKNRYRVSEIKFYINKDSIVDHLDYQKQADREAAEWLGKSVWAVNDEAAIDIIVAQHSEYPVMEITLEHL